MLGSVCLSVCLTSADHTACTDHPFLVAKDISHDVILGTDFLTMHDASVNFVSHTITALGVTLPVGDSTAFSSVESADLPAFTCRVQLCQRVQLEPFHEMVVPTQCVSAPPLPCVGIIEPLQSFIDAFPNVAVGCSVVNSENPVVYHDS